MSCYWLFTFCFSDIFLLYTIRQYPCIPCVSIERIMKIVMAVTLYMEFNFKCACKTVLLICTLLDVYFFYSSFDRANGISFHPCTWNDCGLFILHFNDKSQELMLFIVVKQLQYLHWTDVANIAQDTFISMRWRKSRFQSNKNRIILCVKKLECSKNCS